MINKNQVERLELSVINTLQEINLATVSEVQESLGGNETVETIRIVMSKMYEEGKLHREKIGRSYYFEPKPKRKNKYLTDLTLKLASNLISIAFDDEQKENAFEKILDLSKIESSIAKKSYKRKERFIVIIGAGASFNANNNIPLGEKGAEKLLEQQNEEIKKLIEREIIKLSQVYRLNKDDFETKLLAISKFSNDLYDQLKEIYNYRFYPSQFYELLAHLLKNRFVDAIINFNFDELLDQAIEDEINQGLYIKIISDGDVPNSFNDIMIDNRLKIPLYIKPHGTVSHKTSLKFTREDYFNLSSDINGFIGELLSGRLNDEKIPINLLVFGFNMESFEFNELIKKNIPISSKIYIFNKNNPIKDSLLEADLKKKHIVPIHIPRNDNIYSTDKILNTLFSRINNIFRSEYKPRSVLRHVLISKLFSDKEIKKGINLEGRISYFKDRTYVELILLVSKCFGLISLKQITNDRVGIYYNLYKTELEKKNERNDKMPKQPVEPIFKFCENIGLVQYGYSREFYTLSKNHKENFLKLTISSESFFDNYVNNNNLLDRIKNKKYISDSLFMKLHDDKINDLFKRTLKELFKAEDSEICPVYNHIYDNIFSNPEILNTKLSLDYQTKRQINGEGLENWDILLSIAETGEWIIKKSVSELKDKKIAMIIADNTHEKKLRKKNNNIIIAQLNWWLHNQHMSIYLRKRDTSQIITNFNNFEDWEKHFKVIKVIYFSRRSRESLINPIILNNDKDFDLVLRTFFAYLAKTKHYGSIDHVRNKDIKEVANKLFIDLKI
jgi:predicted transcriptional regulator